MLQMLCYFFLNMLIVLSSSLCIIQLLSSIVVNSGFQKIHLLIIIGKFTNSHVSYARATPNRMNFGPFWSEILNIDFFFGRNCEEVTDILGPARKLSYTRNLFLFGEIVDVRTRHVLLNAAELPTVSSSWFLP